MTLLNDTLGAPEKFGPAARDYERMAQAIRFLERERGRQPRLEEVASAMGLSPTHAQKVFTRWAGVSPKRCLAALTHAAARDVLTAGGSVLDAALESGLSGPGRLHDLFLNIEAMTPGEVKAKGAGLTIYHGVHDTPFGAGLFMATDRGLCALGWREGNRHDRDGFDDLASRWPRARFVHDQAKTAPYAEKAFAGKGEMTLHLSGTPFQVQVWRALLEIPPGSISTYSDIAREVCTEKATRAVGNAVGRNHISWLIPCHRVLRASGTLGGYHWGLTRKKALLAYEEARA